MEEKDSAGKTGAEAAVDNVTRKRKKRTSRKEILELLQHKNEMLQDMEETIQRLEESIKNKDDRIVRMVAEFENFRKRTRREWELLQKQANAELIKDILGILDDFDRALEAMGEAKDHFHSGVRMIYGGLLDILKKAGLREVAALEKPFDPQYHEAMGEIESDEVEPGFVAHVVQKGYLLNDQLLRPARVVVSKGRKPEEEPDE